MNYIIYVVGRGTSAVFDKVLKLFIESAKASDYLVNSYSYKVKGPCSSYTIRLELLGSAKKEPLTAVFDLDNVYCDGEVDLLISPKVLQLDTSNDLMHYWGIMGTLFKIVPDLSPAYFTSYLIENELNQELALFKQYSNNSLPKDIAAAVSKLQNI